MPPTEPGLRWGPWSAAAVGAVLTVLGLTTPARAPAGPPCRPVALVDGTLTCTAGPRTDACGESHVLRPGDVFDSARCATPGRMAPEDLAALQIAIDINHADVQDLQSLPGVGPVLARRIVEGRPYHDVASLVRVRGIGPRTLQAITPRARVPAP